MPFTFLLLYAHLWYFPPYDIFALCYHAHYTHYARKKITVTMNGTSL